MQALVLLITLILMAVIVGAFFAAVRATMPAPQTEAWERGRAILIVATVVVGVLLLIATLYPWPHAPQAGPISGRTVKVSAYQWYWEMEPSTLPVGESVTFLVHAADVNHGFAVVDPDGRLLFQVQAMPGYVNRVRWTFDRPGTYRIYCLEYCGLSHHEMILTFEVQPGA